MEQGDKDEDGCMPKREHEAEDDEKRREEKHTEIERRPRKWRESGE